MTGEGTNTYLYGADPCAVIDPGPDIAEHIDAVLAAAEERGGIGIVLLTHHHGDHSAGAERLEAEAILPTHGEEHAGLRALATPGHAAEHFCFLTADRVCFSGDLVLGAGSTFVPPDGGSLAAHMESLRLVQAEEPSPICPDTGPGSATHPPNSPSTSSTARCASAVSSPPSIAASDPATLSSPRSGTTFLRSCCRRRGW